MLIKLTEKNYETNIKTGLKIVEFYAPWCEYCRNEEKELIQLEKIWIGQVNVDDEEELVTRNAIHSFPTFLIYKNGTEMERFIGYRNKEEILNALLKYIK